ncbi:uncharacterized protein [Antedon mediterranea]
MAYVPIAIALQEICQTLEQYVNGNIDRNLLMPLPMRLEVIIETIIGHENIRLEVIDNLVASKRAIEEVIGPGQVGDEHPTTDSAMIHTGRPGRARFVIGRSQLQFFVDNNFTVQDMSKMFSVSKRTIERRLQEYNMTTRNYTDISSEFLDARIGMITMNFPRSGLKSIEAHLMKDGIRVRREALRDSVKRVDPVGRHLRSLRCIRRRVYSVPSPLALWHIDGNHKLIK